MHGTPSPRSIVVIGCGNIGSSFAFQLSCGGHNVTVVARPGSARLEELRRDRAIIDAAGGRAHVTVADRLDDQAPYDLAIVTVLAHQMAAVLPVLVRSRARCIQFMFNTFEPKMLRSAIGIERSAFGMPFVLARRQEGKRHATIGAGGQRTLLSQQRWVDVFDAAGLPAKLEDDMPLWLRCHAPLCVAFESVSVAAMRRGGGAAWVEASVLARGVQACFGLIRALGYPVQPRSKRLLDHAPIFVVAALLWSMSRVRSFRESLATGQLECAALVDSMVAASSQVESPTAEIEAMKPL